jgi:hypothetical protein
MEYMLLVCHDESFDPPDDIEPETIAWVEEMTTRGVRRQGDRLRPASDATTVRVREDEVLLSDGPFAETKEQMAGYMVLECEDLDEATEWVRRMPVSGGAVEVRPIAEMPGAGG